jgi:hypothetical protein
MKKARLILLIITGLLLLNPPFACAKRYRYSDYLVNIFINPDGTFKVREKMTFDFQGDFSYAYRNITVRKVDYISGIKVFDGERRLGPLERKIRDKLGEVEIKWYFNLSDTQHSWVVEYIVHGGLGFFDSWDELYWNTIPHERTVPIDNLEVYVNLPEMVNPQEMNHRVYAENASLSRGFILDAETFYFEGRDIAPNSNFTIVAGWPKGLINYAQVSRSRWFRPNALKAIVLPLLTLMLMYSIWNAKGRDIKTKTAIIPQFKPPEELNPVLAGVLIDDRVDVRDIIALIIDLAIRGYITITEEKLGFWAFKSKIYKFTRTTKQEGLRPVETFLLENMFKHGFANTVTTTGLKDKFYKDIPRIKEILYEAVGKEGRYYEGSPEKIRKRFTWCLWTAFVMLWVIFAYLGLTLFPVWLVISVFTSLLIIGGFGFFMPRRTQLGARVRNDLLGFKMYLQSAERFRLAECTPQTFEKYLPYAVAMQIEDKWAARFKALSDYRPTWYTGYYGTRFSTVNFSRSFSGLITGISTCSAAPSRGSGFGGGGFAGGGGGGGGGGAG